MVALKLLTDKKEIMLFFKVYSDLVTHHIDMSTSIFLVYLKMHIKITYFKYIYLCIYICINHLFYTYSVIKHCIRH